MKKPAASGGPSHALTVSQPVVKLQLHSAGDASPLTALLLPPIFPIRHPTVHKTHGGDPALRSSRPSAGVPTARTVRRGVEQRGASPPSVRRRTFTTDCYPGLGPAPARSPARQPRWGARAVSRLSPATRRSPRSRPQHVSGLNADGDLTKSNQVPVALMRLGVGNRTDPAPWQPTRINRVPRRSRCHAEPAPRLV